MNSFLKPEARARRRLRRSAELLMEDSSLRDNLSDGQAKALLDWGIAQLRETAEATSQLEDEMANPLLEERVALVRRVMRLVSRLMGAPGVTSSHETSELVGRLLASLERLKGSMNSPEQSARAAILEHNREQLDGASRFQLLMELARQEVVDYSDEEA